MQAISLKLKGLYTYPNPLGKALPDGALLRATNCVIDADDEIRSRRGFNRLVYGFSNSTDRASKLFSYQGKLLASYTGDKLAWYDSGSGWTDYSSTYAKIAATARIRSAEANQNFYFTTSTGVKKLDVYNGTPTSAGVPKGLDMTVSLNAAGTGFLSDDTQIAYRHVWGIRDANNNVILGAPSARAVLTNSAGSTKDVDYVISIPSGITTSHFYQVYRSDESGDAAVEPNDECQLVYEANPTSGEITAGVTGTITDQTPNDLRGATIYTAPSQGDGIVEANERPPLSRDIAEFSSSLFYADTVSKHRKIFTILAVGAPNGLQSGDVLTIAGTTYTAAGAENIGTRAFKVFSAGSASQNIADTAQSLIKIVNRNATNTTVYAYYLSGENDLPGQILIEERSLGGASFAITASAHGSAYNPALPTSGTSVSSSNDTFKNALYFSKYQEPEAVPLTNLFRIGSAASRILRLVPLRDSLFVLKEDGIWRVVGADEDFRVEGVDRSTKLLAPETAVVLNNQIFALTDQGVAIITESGVSIVSRPIEGTLLELFGASSLDALKQYSFGIGYETDRKYVLFTISSSGVGEFGSQAFVYNTFTNTWTDWPLSGTCGIVNPADDKIYYGDANSHYTKQERKAFNYSDYIDQSDDFTLTAAAGTSLTFSTVTGIEVGDLLYQSGSVNSIVSAVDTVTRVVTVSNTLTWSLGTVTLYKAIESVIEWPPQTGGNPGLIHNFQEASVFLRDRRFTECFLGFKTPNSAAYEEVTIAGDGGSLWGMFPWGQNTWGGQRVSSPFRTYVPLEKSRSNELSVRFRAKLAYQRFALLGISIPFESGNAWVRA